VDIADFDDRMASKARVSFIGWASWRNPVGEKTQNALKLHFDRRLRLEFHGARITSDAGLLAYRELDDALRLTEMAPAYLQETREGRNVHHARKIIFQLAEVAVPGELFAAVLERITRLCLSPG